MSDSILIIGAGVAGINCALNAAKYGTHVYLVDDTASIGGLMARLDKTFPTNDCSPSSAGGKERRLPGGGPLPER
jgi:heterodisulfide reductase subunit A2